MIKAGQNGRIFHLCAGGMSVVLYAGDTGIRSLYWGCEVDERDFAAPEALADHSGFDPGETLESMDFDAYDGRRFTLPCLKADGGRDRYLVLTYAGHETGREDGTEILRLFYEEKRVRICVTYILYPEGILGRKVTLQAHQACAFDTAFSGALCLPQGQQSVARYVTGRWGGEFQLQEEPVRPGLLTLQSRRGITGPHFNPSVMLAEPEAQEEQGRVWSAMLAYSGNWMLQVEQNSFGNTRIVAGVSSFDHVVALEEGESYETPVLYAGCSGKGLGGMSRRWHRFINNRIMPERKPRPVLYNSWEAVNFDVEAERQKELARIASRMGCELFVVDDGWFVARSSEHAGLGDWFVNESRFPKGLDDLISYVKSLGMDFGIWIEPEAVNPDSDLYRAHPDWAYHTGGREGRQLRFQYELNLSLPQVRDYLKDCIRKLLGSHDIAYVKWDMNRALTDVDCEDGDARKLWEGHAAGLYELWAMIRDEFPHVELETCSGGGGRIDPGILRYAHQFWTTDNTDPYDRLLIQYGCSYFYPVSAMMCWVTDSGAGARKQASLAYRFHSSMCGGLGIGADITKFSEEQIETCREFVEVYKRHREVIQYGDLYRIGVPGQDNISAVLYISPSKEEAVLFAFLHSQCLGNPAGRIRLPGLSPDKRYRLSSGEVMSGKTLANAGLPLQLTGDYDSVMVVLMAE